MKGKKTGGRAKGSLNKFNQAVEDTANRLEINFFESLCLFAKGDWKALGYDSEVYVKENASGATTIGYTISPDMRLKAIEQGCRYLYSPKLAADKNGDSIIKVFIEDYTKE